MLYVCMNVEEKEREQAENSCKINICKSNLLLTKHNQSDDNNHLKQQKCWLFVENCPILGKSDLNAYDLLLNSQNAV